MPFQNDLPEHLKFAMESLIRAATAEGYCVVGAVFRDKPLSIGILRNTKDDPVQLFQAVADMLEFRIRKGAPVKEEIVGQVN